MSLPKSDWAIIITGAGSSTRFGQGNKLLADLNGHPVFMHSVLAFASLVEKENFVLTVPEVCRSEFEDVLLRYQMLDKITLVNGGSCRSESVALALGALHLDSGRVAIHDAARPLAAKELMSSLLSKSENIITGRRIYDSVKRIGENGQILEAVDRTGLFRAETPQVFDLASYRQALVRTSGCEFTDDAQMMQSAGFPVFTFCDDAPNLKITSFSDLEKCRELVR